MGPLGGHREALELGDRIVTASKSDHGSNEQSLEDPHGLLQPFDPDPRWVERHAGPLVLVARPTSADAKLQAAS